MKIKPMSIVKVVNKNADTYNWWGIIIAVKRASLATPIDVWHPLQRGLDEARKIGFFRNFTNFSMSGMLMSYPRSALKVLNNIDQRLKLHPK